MTEEIKNVELKEETCKCFCQNKTLKKFLVIAGGTFVGVFCALSLFAALHKPPVIPPPFVKHSMHHCPYQMQHHHFKGYRGDFHRKYMNPKFEKRMNIENKSINKLEDRSS